MKRARIVHLMDESTTSALAKRKNGQTLRALARELGEPQFSIAMLSNVLCHRPGKVSLATENDLRQRLGLHPIGAVVISRCPSCGGAHVLADCHGAPVAAVVGLAPGRRSSGPARRVRAEPTTARVWRWTRQSASRSCARCWPRLRERSNDGTPT